MISVPNINLDKIKRNKQFKILLYPVIGILAVIGANYLFDYVMVKKKLFANPISRMQLYYKEKNYLKVIELAENLLNKNQDSVTLRRYLWKSYLYTKQFGNAIKQLEKIEKNNPNNVEVNIDFCNLYRYMENFEKAKYFCEKALDIEPTSEQAQDLIIQILLEQKRFDEATKYLDSNQFRNPNKLKTFILRAAIATAQNDYKTSIAILEEAKKNYHDVPLIYFTLGMNYFEITEYTKAVGYLEEFTEQANADEIASDQLGTAYETLGAAYEKSNMYLNANRTYKNAACLGMRRGHTDFAIRMLKKAVNTTYVGYSGFVSGKEFDKRFNAFVKELESKCDAKLFSSEGVKN